MQSFYLLMPSGWEIIVILFVILLLFGGRKIPELMRGLGRGIREFNSAKATIETEIKEGMKEADRKKLEEQQDQASATPTSSSSKSTS
ncbi:MAG: twin-arginine translocase TatA/TatE family subunit [Saprospiraceae bacterium]|nr:twin-arginine translocase TatA/TatE family subunit [Saprospiraceae bacterium]